MIRVTVIDREHQQHILEGPVDMNLNLMELCKAYDLPVAGTCGGMAMCSSCHVYVKSDHDLPERSEHEEDTLDQAFFVDERQSRLCCQIKLRDQLEGLVVELAPDEG